jgi:hypothetical protein
MLPRPCLYHEGRCHVHVQHLPHTSFHEISLMPEKSIKKTTAAS